MTDEHYFDDYYLGDEIDELLKPIPHGVAIRLIKAIRSLLQQVFDAYRDEAKWCFSTGIGNEPTSVFWDLLGYPMPHWGDELPMTLHLTPEAMKAAMLETINDYMCGEDRTIIAADTKAEVLQALAAWRDVLADVERAVQEKRVAPPPDNAFR